MFILSYLVGLPKNLRKSILIALDVFAVVAAISLVHTLFYSKFDISLAKTFENTIIFSILTILIYIFSGHYKQLTKYIKSNALYQITLRHTFLFVILTFINRTPTQFNFLFSIILCFIIHLKQYILSDLLCYSNNTTLKRIVIYGAGAAGAKLANSLA